MWDGGVWGPAAAVGALHRVPIPEGGDVPLVDLFLIGGFGQPENYPYPIDNRAQLLKARS